MKTNILIRISESPKLLLHTKRTSGNTVAHFHHSATNAYRNASKWDGNTKHCGELEYSKLKKILWNVIFERDEIELYEAYVQTTLAQQRCQ